MNVGHHLISGGISGFASAICLQPIDVLKTRVQQRDAQLDLRHASNVFKVAKDILEKEGLTGLWRGTTPTLFRNVPGVALYMTLLTDARTMMASSPKFAIFHVESNGERRPGSSVLPKLSNEGNLLAGATARTGVGFVLNPITVLKARYESNLYAYTSFPKAFSSILQGGPRVLLKGFIPSAMRDAPYAGFFVAFYEGCKAQADIMMSSTNSALSATAIHSLSAAAAATLATFTTQPFDVIKTKVQVRKEDRYQSLRRTVSTILEQRGVLGLFDGVSLRLSRKIGSSIIGWVVYESLLTFMDGDKAKSKAT